MTTLASEPFVLAWEYRARDYLVRTWDPAVRIHGDQVFGLWFCLNLLDGGVVWEARHRRLDKIVGLGDGFIVATQEYDFIGPLTVGVYGLSAATGELLWTNHGPGPLRWIRRAMDFLPLFFTNEGRDFPLAVANGKVLCRSGRVLDVRTGDPVQRDEAWASEVLAKAQETPDERLMRPTKYGTLWQTQVKETKAVRWSLSHRSREVWGFDSVERGLHLDSGHSALVGDSLLIITADEPVWVPSKDPWRVEQNPTQRRLLVVDMATGEFVHVLPLTTRPERGCDFQAWTGECALIRRGSNELLCVRRADLSR